MDATSNLIKVTFQDDQFNIPSINPADYGFDEHDDLVATVIDGVLMIGTRLAIGDVILAKMRENFEADGVTLEDLLEEHEKVRQELYDERFKDRIEG